MKRAIVIVLDGCGAGEAPDAAAFGDIDHPSTIKHVWDAAGGLFAPNLEACGFFAACGVPAMGGRARVPTGRSGTDAEDSVPTPSAIQSNAKLPSRYGRLRELSMGKDSVTGHWEMMGVLTAKPFPTYPLGFPADLVQAFEKQIGIGVLGNKPASGTEIIKELGEEHIRTGKPILYTSADSVFQIACHEEVVPLAQLYEMCEAGRGLCKEPNNVQRVIARPFIGDAEHGFVRTGGRKDYPWPAPPNAVDLIGDVVGIGPIPELFGGRGFRELPRTQRNSEHAAALLQALESDARFIFANFEDFDMLYGHRNDAAGFAAALEAFDVVLGQVLARLGTDDLLILTADHGNDPTTISTDHSREYVPVCVVRQGLAPGSVGDVDGMMAVGATVLDHLGIANELQGESLAG